MRMSFDPVRLRTATLGFVSRQRRWLAAVSIVIVAFGLVGYLWLPGFVKSKAEAALSELLHRPVSIERVQVSPYALALTVHGLRVAQQESEAPLLAFESLSVNLSSVSLLRLAPVISAVTLVKPQVHLVRAADGRLSIADLLDQFSARPAAPAATAPARFAVSNIEVRDGLIVLDDRLKQSRQEISALHLGLPFVASFESSEDVWVEPYFSARLNGGAPLEIHGRALPFADRREVVADVDLDGFDLTGVDEYAALPAGLKLLSGKLDTHLKIAFVQAPKTAPSIRISGETSLRDLNVSNSLGLPWQLQGQRLTLHLKEADALFASAFAPGFTAENVRIRQGRHPEMQIARLELGDVLIDPAARNARFNLAASVNTKGEFKLGGKVGWAPLMAELDADIREFDLVPLQGWLSDRLNATLTRGAAHFAGSIKAAGTPLNVTVQASARLTDLNVLDPQGAQDWLRWRSLDMEGIRVSTSPLDVAVDKIALADFFGRIAVSPEGRLNLKDMFRPAAGAGVTPDRTDTSTTAGPALSTGHADADSGQKTSEQKAALPVRIGQILLQGGRVDFNDRFIKPNYRVNLTGLGGKIGPLEPGKPGMVDIRGAIDRSAPVQILGRVDPFGSELALDITAKAKGIDLPSFSPYSGKYVGYAIEKGKLSVDVHYLIDKGNLTAENNIFLDQLTFGEKIESADAMNIPVNLAVALLRNSRGEIDINLPISGSLNDPQFSVGSIVVKVFVNLIVKAVTSPFALLGSLFGGGADLSQADFAPGYTRLTPDAEKRIDALAKAMSERPALKLEITGVADAANDREGLRRATLERRVKAQKLAELARQGQSGGSISDVDISPAEYPKYLELAYRNEKFDKPRNLIGFTKSLPVPEMEQLMLANLPAGDEELRGLAERRALRVRTALIEKGVPPERIFTLQPKVEQQAEGRAIAARAEFSLR